MYECDSCAAFESVKERGGSFNYAYFRFAEISRSGSKML